MYVGALFGFKAGDLDGDTGTGEGGAGCAVAEKAGGGMISFCLGWIMGEFGSRLALRDSMT